MLININLSITLTEEECNFIKTVEIINVDEIKFDLLENFDVYNSLLKKGIILFFQDLEDSMVVLSEIGLEIRRNLN